MRLIIIIFVLSSIFFKGFAQCPLDIYETPILNNNGLVLYLPFNGNVQNFGSGTNSATLSGATYSSGICGQSLHFDGYNDYVKITPYINMTGNFTISTWVYLDTLIYEQEIFTTREQCQTTYRRYSQSELAINHNPPSSGLQADRILYMINHHQNCTGYAVGDRYEPPNITYSSGNWFFLTVTIQNNNIENRTVNFYLNCQQLSSNMFANANTGFLFNTGFNYNTYIGGGPNIGTYHYSLDGKIDEFRLYNRILTQNEILDLYYTCKPLEITINSNTSCVGDSAIIELINTQNGMLYQLFDSTTQQYIGGVQTGSCNNMFFSTGLVTSQKDFYIKVENPNNGCTTILDTVISLNPNYSSSNYYDTLFACPGDSMLIKGNYYFPPATIIDTNSNSNGCDSIITTQLNPKIIQDIDLGTDTVICNGDSILLSVPGNYNTYLWNTGATQNSIYATNAGVYWLEVKIDNCKSRDSINILNLENNYILISDTTLCNDKPLTINLPTQNLYEWSTGSQSNTITILDSGLYWVNIEDYCKKYNEEFYVHHTDCSCLMIVPNAFTPNGDGLNDYFFPVINCNINKYELYIYNRWGRLLFFSNKQDSKWDGKFNNNEVPDGVYYYIINYRQEALGGIKNQKTGSITLLR